MKLLSKQKELQHINGVRILDEKMSQFINDKNLQVCKKCGTVVERAEGCLHMTCRCKHQFCYACGSDWNTCPCNTLPADEVARALREPIPVTPITISSRKNNYYT